MNKTSKKIDRGTLLKGSGAAAFLAILATAEAASKPMPSPTPGNDCCEPGDDGFGFSSTRKLKANPVFVPIRGVWLKKGSGNAVPTTPPRYKPAYVIKGATGSGHVVSGPNATRLNNMAPKDIYVFIEK